MARPLTPAQERILDDVIRDGERKYNGLAERPIRALEQRGLVEVDWNMALVGGAGGTVKGSRWIITVRPKGNAVGDDTPGR